jgi:D-glycero-alpha-D-manno-heptose-7-phosphate kinase
VTDRSQIEHPIFREVLNLLEIDKSIEIISMADIPAGTGLGSSGSFTVGLIRALYAHRREHISSQDLAEMACDIEINKLSEPVGKQDQYIASFGGINCFEFRKDGNVDVAPLALSLSTLHDLELNLVLFFTGYSRSASGILKDQSDKSNSGDADMRKNLDETQALGRQIKDCLENGDAEQFGLLMNDHWQRKRRRSTGMTNPTIDELYELGMTNGAVGGKLVGAGAGGFLMFYANDAGKLRNAFRQRGLEEVVFRFDHDGSTILSRG